MVLSGRIAGGWIATSGIAVGRIAVLGAIVFIFAAVPAAFAHDARPLSVTLVEQTGGVWRAVVRVPPTVEMSNTPSLEWPERCEIHESAPLRFALGSTSLVACPEGIEGLTLGIDYPAWNPSITTLIRVEPVDGLPLTAVLPPDELAWVVPPEPTFVGVARDYLVLGFEHILGGIDHLLFVAGLMLLARTARRIVLAVTGFTVAHSITLSLAALGIVRVPIAPVEAMIALSILFLAAEIARGERTSFSHRFPIALSFVFGLLHGFGFASALGEIGLPRGELATGLLFFNIGVELGQLAFIGSIAVVAVVALRVIGRRGLIRADRIAPGEPDACRDQALSTRLGVVGAYALGLPASFWFFERTAAAFGV